MAGYATPAWVNDAAPAIDADALTALGEAAELGEHPYGVCSTAAATAAKTVTVDFSGTLTLFTGLTVRVKFTNANTAANPTLSVNGTTAAPLAVFGETGITSLWAAGAVVYCTYDGTNWLASTSRVVTLTSQEYQNLSAAAQNADIVYVITDDYSGTTVYTKAQVDALLALKQDQLTVNGNDISTTVDSTPTTGNTTHLVSSDGVKSALTHDLANIVATGSTNTTGAVITSGTYFYLNDTLVRAKADIAVNATFTSGTNYETVTDGGLNNLKAAFAPQKITLTAGTNITILMNESYTVGKIVVVALRIKATADIAFGNNIVVTGFPLPTLATSSLVWACVLAAEDTYPYAITDTGKLIAKRAWATNDSVVLSGCYIRQ